jgi:hypothetical protein
MGDQHAGKCVGAVQTLNEGEDCLGGAFVQVARGLIRQQHARLGDERAGERDALLLAA